MRLYMTTAGQAAIKNAVDTATPLTIDSFRLGEDEAYTPDPSASQPMPYSVYHGSAADMRFWTMANNDLAIICLIKGNVGLLSIGNIMLYAGATAICAGVFRTPYRKWQVSSDRRTPNYIPVTFGFHTPEGKNLAAALNLSALTPAYAAANSVTSELALPKAPLTRTSIQRVQEHSMLERPALVFKSSANTPDSWISIPLVPIADTADNEMRGGVMGDEYQ